MVRKLLTEKTTKEKMHMLGLRKSIDRLTTVMLDGMDMC